MLGAPVSVAMLVVGEAEGEPSLASSCVQSLDSSTSPNSSNLSENTVDHLDRLVALPVSGSIETSRFDTPVRGASTSNKTTVPPLMVPPFARRDAPPADIDLMLTAGVSLQ